MNIKMLAAGPAVASLAFAGAAFAQNYDNDGIPASSPNAATTVNPMPERDWTQPSVTEKSTVLKKYSDPDAYLYRNDAAAPTEARVPISTDVAASLGVPVEITASAPVPDTRANRARYGGPMSNAGRNTRPAGN